MSKERKKLWQPSDKWIKNSEVTRFIQYVNKDGVLEDKKQRKFFSVIDGIIGGERDGPLNPSKKKSVIIVVGEEILLNDLIATKIMGFEYKEIPLLKNALLLKSFPLIEKNYEDKIRIISNDNDLHNNNLRNLNLNLNYIPSIGWKFIRKNWNN